MTFIDRADSYFVLTDRSRQSNYRPFMVGAPGMPWEIQFDYDEALAKAIEVFWAQGYEATSMQQLVDRMGIHKGSMYASFGAKKDLFVTALRQYDDVYRRQRLEKMEQENAPMEAIRALLQGIVDRAFCGDDPRGCLIVNTALELADHDDEVGAVIAHSQSEIEAFFRRQLILAREQGDIGAELNTEQTAAALLGTLTGLQVLSRSRPEKKLLQAIADSALASLH